MKCHGHFTAAEIDQTISSAVHFLKQRGAAEKDILVFRLTLEEILLIYQEKMCGLTCCCGSVSVNCG